MSQDITSRGDAATYEFGRFRLNADEGVLLKDGAPVPLAPKAVQTLLILVQRAGQVISKDELMAEVWPDTFVQESNLTQYIFLLRRALGDGDEAYIETIPRRGYRFRCAVTRPPVDEVVVATRTRMHVVSHETSAIRPRAAVMIAAAAALLLASGFALSRVLVREEAPSVEPHPAMPVLSKLTSDSNAHEPAISPDGKLVAYKVVEGTMEAVMLRDVARKSTVQVAPPTRNRYRALAFSPDGADLYYKSYRAGVKNGIIFRMPIFGGPAVEIAREVWSDFAFSPDGREVVFLRQDAADSLQRVFAARVDGGGERVIGTNTRNAIHFQLWDVAPSWSPDGQRLTIAGWMQEEDVHRPALFEMRVRDGAVRELGTRRFAGIHQVSWLPDGSGIVIAAQDATASPSQVWLVDAKTLAATRVTNDLNEYNKFKVTADSRQLVVEQQLSFEHIWLIPGGDETRARQLTFGSNDSDGYFGMVWTPQNRLLFVSDRSGEEEIWSMNIDGSDRKQLTAGVERDSNVSPKASRDGRYIVFCSDRDGKSQLWRMDVDGRNLLQLTRRALGANLPEVSPDGRWVYFTDYSLPRSQIARVPIDGGEVTLLEHDGSLAAPIVSPNGKWIAHDYYDDVHGWRNGIMPAAGGKSRLFPWHSARGMVRWMPDSRGLVYNDALGNLWVQPIDGAGEPRQLTRFTDGRIWTFALSPDGKDYAVLRGDTLSDVVLIRDLRAKPSAVAHAAK